MHRTLNRSWLVVVPTILLLLLALALTGTTNAAPAAGLVEPQTQTPETPVCATCHTQAETDWQASPHAKAGATCESCHGAYKEGHPTGETMTLPMESETCQTCHDGCVQSVGNQCPYGGRRGLLRLPQGTHPGPAHRALGEVVFSLPHQGRDPADAWRPRNQRHRLRELPHEPANEGSMRRTAATKSATTPSPSLPTCAPGATPEVIHGAQSAAEPTAQTKAEIEAAALERQDQRVSELEDQVMDYSQQVGRLQNIAIIGMGLSLGIGGMVGLIIGVAAVTLMGRRKQS